MLNYTSNIINLEYPEYLDIQEKELHYRKKKLEYL